MGTALCSFIAPFTLPTPRSGNVRFRLKGPLASTIYSDLSKYGPIALLKGDEMAEWNDPQTTGVSPAATVGVPHAARDAGLRSYMLSVYNYMASGVLLTGIIALLFANSSLINYIVNPATGQATP